MWELAKFLWMWIFIIIVCLIIIIADGFNFFVEMLLTSVGIVGTIMASCVLYVKYREYVRVKILGCRTEWDRNVEKQFDYECRKRSITVPKHNINICDCLRQIESKGLHIELVKEEGIEYNPRKGRYLGSTDWQDKWSKIVFSPKITGWKFCRSIGIILRAHGMSRLNDIDIRRSNSYKIFMHLELLRYNIVIKENDNNLRDCEVTTPRTLRKRLRNRN